MNQLSYYGEQAAAKDSRSKDSIMHYLAESVPRFVVFGKPSSGKTQLCQKMSDMWGCEYVNASKLIMENLASNSSTGKEMMELLRLGKDLSDDFVLDLLRMKLYSPECLQRGFVLDDLPTNSQQAKTIEMQLELLSSLNPPVNCYINIWVDEDVHRACWANKRIDPETGALYSPEFIGQHTDSLTQPSPSPLDSPYHTKSVDISESRLICRHEELPHELEEHLEFFDRVMKPKLDKFLAERRDVPVLFVSAGDMGADLFQKTIQAIYVNSDNPSLKCLDLFGYLEEENNKNPKDSSTGPSDQTSTWKKMRGCFGCGKASEKKRN